MLSVEWSERVLLGALLNPVAHCIPARNQGVCETHLLLLLLPPLTVQTSLTARTRQAPSTSLVQPTKASLPLPTRCGALACALRCTPTW
jgi:hypothetical protein